MLCAVRPYHLVRNFTQESDPCSSRVLGGRWLAGCDCRVCGCGRRRGVLRGGERSREHRAGRGPVGGWGGGVVGGGVGGFFFFFSSRRRHTRFDCDWSSDVCSSDLAAVRPSGRGSRTIRTDLTWRATLRATVPLASAQHSSRRTASSRRLMEAALSPPC